MEGLLNLENLSKEERNQILLVLRKDDLIRQTEDRKISQLKQEIQALRMRSVLRDGDDLSKMCARCHAELGMFFNRGEMCPKCHFRVCKLCQECLLNGSWLCLLCYKQRQLKWFLGDWEPGKPTRWPSGADMVKASLKKKHLIKGGTGSVGDNIDHSKDEIQNGNPMQNGTARSEKHSAERLEFPRDSDQRKLTQLFDNFKLPRKKEPAQETKHVKRISSRKYSDSESEESDSSTSGNDELVETIKHSPHKNVGSKEHLPEPPPDYDDDEKDHIFKENDAHEVKRNTADNSDRKMLNRTHSDDSDQTLLSDDVPFSKSSTETQIKVDIQSDSPKSSPNLDHHRIPKSKSDLPEKPRETKTIKQSATDIIMALKLGKRQSPVPKKSLSPDVGGKKQSVSRQPNDLQFQAGRSPSPFSFDSLPSSHAASPLPQKRLADLAVECNTSKESDTDSMSQLSATDVHESSSGADDCTVEELSKVHFRRISARSPGRTSSSSPSPPPQLDEQRGYSGEGREEGGQHNDVISTQQLHSEGGEVECVTQSMVPETVDLSDLLHNEPNISFDLSLTEIEKDCLEYSDQYDISVIAQEAHSLLTTQTSVNKGSDSVGNKKSPAMKKRATRSSSSKAENVKKESENEGNKHDSGTLQTGVTLTIDTTLTEIEASDEPMPEVLQQRSPRRKLPSIPSDSGLTGKEQNPKVGKSRTNVNVENPSEEEKVKLVEDKNQYEHSVGSQRNLSTISKVTMDDSGRHDSLDSLLQTSVFDESKKVESVGSFELSPITPISPDKMKTKPTNYCFTFVNDSVFAEESSDGAKRNDSENTDAPEVADFDEIYKKAIDDLQSDSINSSSEPRKGKKVKSSKKEMEEKGSFNSKQTDDGAECEEPIFGTDADDIKIHISDFSAPSTTFDRSMLWYFEDKTIEEDYNKLFGKAESEKEQNFAQNRALMLKTVVHSTRSNTSTESDALSVIPEEVELDSSVESSKSLEHEAEHPKIQNLEVGHMSEIIAADGDIGSEQNKDMVNTKDLEEDKDRNELVSNVLTEEEEARSSGSLNLQHSVNTEDHEEQDHEEVIELKGSRNESTEDTGEEKTTTKDESETADSGKLKIGDEKNISSSKVLPTSSESPKTRKPVSVHEIAFATSHIAMATSDAKDRSPRISLEREDLDTSLDATEKLVSSLQAQLSLDDYVTVSDPHAGKDEDGAGVEETEVPVCSPNSSGTLTKVESPQEMSNMRPKKRHMSKQLVEDWLESEMSYYGSKEGTPPSGTENDKNQAIDRSSLPPVYPAPLPEYQTSLYNHGSDQQTRPTLTEFAQSTHIPNLQLLEDDSEKTDSGPTKLSPRASSEGSGSFEDSGLVSGASTENTPEHRRTDSIQSQLSVPSSTISNITDKSSEEADIDDIVATHRSHGSGRGNLLSTIAGSRESILSVYSNAGEVDYGKIPVTGEILLGMDYNYRTGTLEVLVKQCKELAPADTRRNRSDPYVKTYLLPDKTRGGKRKTRIQKNTLNPIFEQTLRYLISKSELENRTLSVTVWHNDRFGRNDFLGEVSINFDYFRFGDSAPKWYTLQEKVETHPTSNLTYRGDLFLSLRYVPPENVSKEDVVVSPSKKKIKKGKSESTPSKGQLHVKIKEARNLTAIRTGGYSDPFVKGYLLPDKHRQVKQKTPVIKRNCNPTWNHTFIFDDIKKDDLKDRCLELTVWDYDKITSNEFLGGIRLNQGVGRSHGKTVDWMDAHGEEISLWQAMMDRPNIWIDGALMLRPNMEKRKF